MTKVQIGLKMKMSKAASEAFEEVKEVVEVFKEGKRKGMMLLDGIDIQLFRDVKEIWNRR